MKKIADLNLNKLEIKEIVKHYCIPSEYKSETEKIWKEKLQKSKNTGRTLWNGKVYRLDYLVNYTEVLNIYISEIDYKTYLSTDILHNKMHTYPTESQINGIYVAAQIRTSDNYYLLGKTSSNSLFKHKYDLISGSLNKDEKTITTNDDLLEFLYEEIYEETGIDKDKIINTKGICILRTASGRIGMFFLVNLNISSEELTKQLKINFEHSKIIYMRKVELLQFIEENKKLVNPTVSFTLKEIN